MFSLVVCVALYIISLKVIGYFHRQNELGIILSLKIFQMAWIVMFAMLVFSCMVSAVSTIFLSRDNEIIFAAPVTPAQIYAMRYITTSLYTSWMMVLFSLPIFAAYGKVFQAGWLYWPLMPLSVVSVAAIATSFGMLATVILVNIFPARRTKDIVLYLSLCFGIFIYVMFRLLRPEDLVNPDKFAHFVDYLSALSEPAGFYVPAAWSANMLSLYLLDRQLDWLLLGLLTVTPVALFILGEWAMQYWFFSGFSKSQESFGGYRTFRTGKRNHGGLLYWSLAKEGKNFIRDSAEWSQIFMIVALVVVYLYNFKLLPVDRSLFREEYITNLISFLNIGLTGFVVASLSARFVYPAIGAEGGAFYIIQAAPISMGRFIAHKFLFYAVPLTCLSLFLVIVSDHLLHIAGPMWWFSVITSTVIVWTIVALALGFGAMYADFKVENRAAALGGIGAILFLFTAMSFELTVIFLGAMPAYLLVKKWIKGIPPTFTDFLVLGGYILTVIALAVGISWYFLRKGINSLGN